MASELLTTAASLQCPHGGSITLSTSNTAVTVDGAPVVLLSDSATVSGCPFQIPAPSGTVPEPCLTVRWVSGASSTMINGTPALLKSSSGLCLNGKQVPQGPVSMVSVQTKAMGT